MILLSLMAAALAETGQLDTVDSGPGSCDGNPVGSEFEALGDSCVSRACYLTDSLFTCDRLEMVDGLPVTDGREVLRCAPGSDVAYVLRGYESQPEVESWVVWYDRAGRYLGHEINRAGPYCCGNPEAADYLTSGIAMPRCVMPVLVRDPEQLPRAECDASSGGGCGTTPGRALSWTWLLAGMLLHWRRRC